MRVQGARATFGPKTEALPECGCRLRMATSARVRTHLHARHHSRHYIESGRAVAGPFALSRVPLDGQV
jgi:uncharacterized RmlC-like cupin family protein